MSSFGALRSSRKILFNSQRGLLGTVLSGWIPLSARGINHLVKNNALPFDLPGVKRPIRAGRDGTMAGAA